MSLTGWPSRSAASVPVTARPQNPRVGGAGHCSLSLCWRWLLTIPTSCISPARAPPPVVTRLDVVIPPTSDPFSFALSPDGRQMVFVAPWRAGRGCGCGRSTGNRATARGDRGRSYPFWAPDSRAIGFFADGKLKRIDLAGGTPQVLADAPAGRGGTWNRDGVVVFAPSPNGG